jgi:hypothetical protein
MTPNPALSIEENTFLLTKKQRRLVALMDYRAARMMPTNHRDLADVLDIRRDSLKKLLRRTRKRMAEEGRELPTLARKRRITVYCGSLSGMDV